MTSPVPEHRLLPDTITFSDDVRLDFHRGRRGVRWGRLITPRMEVEIGTARGPDDLDDLLTMVAGVLMEHPSNVDRTFNDPATGRWVLIDRWVLSARLGDGHAVFDSAEEAATRFDLIVAGALIESRMEDPDGR